MKNILYIWKGEYPWDVRAERICKTLADAGFNVVLLARWNEGQLFEEDFDNYHIRRAGVNRSRFFTTPVFFNPYWKNSIQNAVNDYNIDLIISRDILLSESASDIAHKSQIPNIIDMAENYPAAMKGWKKYNDNLWRKLAVHYLNIPELVEKRAVSKADGIITVCEEQINRLKHQFNFPEVKCSVVMNTPDQNDLIANTVKKDYMTFGHHGFMSAEKGLETFLKGFVMAASVLPDIRLLLAGDGECFNIISQIADSSNLRDKITLTGRYDKSQIQKLLDQIDIGIIPYQVNDFNNTTLHNKLFDFFATGKPILSSEILPTQKILKETNAGKSYDLSSPDKVRDAIFDFVKLDLQNYSINSLNAFQEYNWTNDRIRLVNFIEKYV